MEKQILNKIKEYNTIIIHRHQKPDFDAFGSQMGLYAILKDNFPEKNIYVVGDSNNYPFENEMSEIEDSVYNDALVFILDTSVKAMVSDLRYELGRELIIFDHHKNDTDLNPNLFYKRDMWISCSEMVAEFAIVNNLNINDEAANHLFAGIVGDSGRFQYINNENGSHAFYIASELLKRKVEIRELYDFMQLEPLQKRLAKSLFTNFNLTKNKVAYRVNSQALIKESGLDFFTVSRGMVNTMAGIQEVTIWANFTENEKGEYVAELRSRVYSIVDIAKKYGGGGHDLACGATLKDIEEVQLMIEDLDKKVNNNETKNNL